MNKLLTKVRGNVFSLRNLLLVSILFFSNLLNAQVTLIDPTGDGGFETGANFAANGWTVVNGANTTRAWYVGTGQTGFSGTQAAFIGNTTTTVGTTTAARIVHFYRSITIPAGAVNIALKFKYKQATPDNTFDFLRVHLNPNVPVSGTLQTTGTLVTVDPPDTGNPYTSFTNVTVNVPNAFAGATNNLIFTFRADGFAPHSYGAVDDIELTYEIPTCFAPTGLTLNTVNTTNATISWTSPASLFDIQYGLAPLTLGNGILETGIATNSYTFSNLTPGGVYEFFIRADCGAVDGVSIWDGPFQFFTDANNNAPVCYNQDFFTLRIPDNGCATNNFLVYPIEVSGLVGTQLGTNVSLSKVDLIMTQTFNEDINAFLVSPNNLDVLLVGGRFGSGDNLGNPALCPNGLFTLQAGGLPLSLTNTSNVVGTYTPEEPFTLLNDNSNPNGTWLLAVCDNAAGDVGALRYVRLSFEDLCASFAANAGNDVSICEGGSTTLTATGGGTYLWSTGETTASIVVSPTSNTTYTVTVTDGNSCSLTDTDDVLVTVNTLPTADAGGDVEVCDNAFPYTLTATGGTSFSWSTGATTASIQVSPSATTTYSVTVTDANSCSASTSVEVSLKPATLVNLGNDTTVCLGASVELDGGIADTYFWSTGATTQTITVTPTTGTTYTVTITASNGCVATDAILVDVNTLAPGLAGPDKEICFGSSTTLTATGGTNYVWSTGETTASITVSPTANTTYTVTISVAGVCSVDDDVEVTVNNLPVADAGATQTICPGSSATLTATGGTSYAWSNAATTASTTVTPSVNTTYTVTVSDANNCSAVASVAVNLFPAVTANAGSDVEICEGASTVLTLTTNGTTYLWSTGETSVSITVTPTTNTNYTVTVTGANNCTATDAVLVTVNTKPTTALSANSPICEGTPVVLNNTVSGGGFGSTSVFNAANNTPVAIPDFSANGAVSPVTINGSGNITPLSTVQVTVNITHTFNADLYAYLVGPGGCGTLELFTAVGGSGDNFTNTVLTTAATNVIGSAGNNTAPFTNTYRPEGTLTGTQNVFVFPLPTNGLSGCPINGQWFLVAGDVEQGDVGSIQNWSLQITNPSTYAHTFAGAGQTGTTTLSGASNANATVTYTNVPVGENQFTVTATDGKGCTDDDAVTVKVFAKPVITSVTQSCSTGSDGEITVQATLNNANFTGNDVGVVEYSFDNGNTWGIVNTASNLAVGTYSVVLRNSANPTCTTSPLSVVITSAPVATATNTSPVCEGADFTISTLATGGVTTRVYNGSSTTAFPIPDGSAVGINSPITLSGTGNIAANSIVSVNLNITHPWIEDMDVFLVGPNNCGTLQLTSDNGADGDNYVNTTFATNAANPITGGTPPFTGTFLPEGTLTGAPDLSGDVNGGNYSLPATALAGCPVNGVWTLRAFDDESLLTGTLNNWSLNVTLPGDYTQSVSGPGVISPVTYSGQNNSVATVTVSDAPVGASNYTITVSDVNGCSSSTGTTTAKVFAAPDNVTTSATCEGLLGGSITVQATLDNANFTGNDVGVVEYSYDGGNTWTSNNIATGLSAGNYNIYVRNSASPTCQAGPFSETIFASPTVTVNDPELCVGATVNLTAVSPNNVTYEWSTSETTATITVNADGDYYVTVTDGNGCVGTDTASVTPGSSLTVVLADYEFCDGNTVVLDASNPGATYEWSNGATTQTITVSTSDTYSVTVEAAGCIGTASSEVVVNPLPTQNLADIAICVGETALLDAGNAGDTYEWSTGATTQTIEVSAADVYSVTITNQFACTVTDEAELTVNSLPVVSLQDEEVCEGTTVTLDAGNAGASYTWSPNGETAQTISPLVSDTYTVTVTDGNGCSASASASVTINDNPVTSAGGDQTICEGETVTLTGSGIGDYEWSNAETTTAIVVTPANTTVYGLTITNSNGCSATDEATITVNTNPTAFVQGDLNACSTAGTDLLAGGGVGYEWSTGETTAGISVTPQVNTTYVVTVTAQNGCTDTETVTVTVTPGPTANAGSNVGICEGSVITLFGGGGTSYVWSTGVTTSNITISPTTTTTYTLTVTDPSGCSDSTDVTVFVNALPTVSIDIDETLFCLTDGDETLTGLPAGGAFAGTGVSGSTFSPATAGEGAYILSYTFTDANQCTNIAEVSVAVQTCSSVEDLFKALEAAKVYPNPFMNQINISFVSNDANNLEVKLYDVLGKEIYSETMQVLQGDNTLTLNTNTELAGGIYHLKLVKENKSTSFRLIKTE